MLETEERHIWSPGWKDPLEEEMATHSSILAWKVPRTEELVGYSPWGLRALDTTKRARARAHTHTHTRTHGHVSINLYLQKRKWSESHSVMSDSLWPCGLYSPWNSPGQNTGVGSLSLLQGILPIQGLNPGLPHCRQILCQLSHHGSQKKRSWGHIWPRGHCLPRLDLK